MSTDRVEPRAYAAARERRLVYQAAYRQANSRKIRERRSRTREKRLAWQRAYNKRNVKKRTIYARRWCQANREKSLSYHRAYYHRNREKILANRKAATSRRNEKVLPHQPNKHTYLDRYPDTLLPGQYLEHCGQFQLLTQLPHTCVVCGERFFEEEVSHD